MTTHEHRPSPPDTDVAGQPDPNWINRLVHGQPGGGERYRTAIVGVDSGPLQAGGAMPAQPSLAGAVAAVPQLELVAASDSDAERLRRFVDQTGVTEGYRDYRELLKAQPVHVLIVNGPVTVRHDVVLEAVMAGVKAVFCLSPLAATADKAQEVVEACKSAGVILAVGYLRRWEPACLRARQLLEQGQIGRLESMVGHYPGRAFSVGAHLFDLMRWFAGDAVWACGDAIAHGESEPSVSGHLRFRSDVRASVVAGWDHTNHLFEIDLLGSRGRLTVRADGTLLALSQFEAHPGRAGGCELAPASGLPLETIREPHLVAALRDLASCLRTDRTPRCSGEDGAAAFEIACALVESAERNGERIALPLGAARTMITDNRTRSLS